MMHGPIHIKITVIRLPSHSTHTLQPSNSFYGALKRHFKSEAAASEITRYHMAPITGFTRSKDASVAVGVSVLASMGIYSSNRNRMPNIFSLFLIAAKLQSLLKQRRQSVYSLLQEPILKMCYLSQQNPQ